MSRSRKVVALLLAVFVAGLAVEHAVSMACPMEKAERCACCDDKAARISDDANECCTVLSVARRAAIPAELTPVGAGLSATVSWFTSPPSPAAFHANTASRLSIPDGTAPPGVATFLLNLCIRC